jgi:hypothetical protein
MAMHIAREEMRNEQSGEEAVREKWRRVSRRSGDHGNLTDLKQSPLVIL